MPVRHVVVDGSNIATEGRSLPSLAQLDQAVREFLKENPEDVVTVVVDASFGHRIEQSELATYEEAEEAGEVVSPPAGAIGRGDAFLLRIAQKTGATVLSNDSFQEFHGEHEWLFDKGRLIGGKPVPGVGWIFTPRIPVRGPRSREAVKEARRQQRAGAAIMPASSGLDLAALRAKGGRQGKRVERAIAVATEEVTSRHEVGEEERPRRRRRSGQAPPAEPVNEPLTFITFIADHPLGATVDGVVEEFSSHGAFVEVAGTRCYVPLSAMGTPAPRRAKDVLTKGEARGFVVQALDPLRRGVELALPGFARLAGGPTEETVEAEIGEDVAEPADSDATVPAGAVEAGEGAAVESLDSRRSGRRAAASKVTAKKAGASAEKAAARAVAKKAASKAIAEARAGEDVRVAEQLPAAEEVPAAEAAGAVEKARGKKAPTRKGAGAPKESGVIEGVGAPAETSRRRAGATKKAAGATKKAATKSTAATKKDVGTAEKGSTGAAPATGTAGTGTKKASTADKKATATQKGASVAKKAATKGTATSAKAGTAAKAATKKAAATEKATSKKAATTEKATSKKAAATGKATSKKAATTEKAASKKGAQTTKKAATRRAATKAVSAKKAPSKRTT